MLHLDFSLGEQCWSLYPSHSKLSDTIEGSGLEMTILNGQVCIWGMEMREVYVARLCYGLDVVSDS